MTEAFVAGLLFRSALDERTASESGRAGGVQEIEEDRVLDQIFGVEIPTPIKFVLAFAVVILLIALAAWLIRKFGGKRIGGAAGNGRSRQPRLGVLDVLAIDGRRRLVIVRRDNVEHLVMIGGPNDLVVESGILRVPAGMAPQRDAPAAEAAPSRTAPPPPAR